jgi:hypothetical protein
VVDLSASDNLDENVKLWLYQRKKSLCRVADSAAPMMPSRPRHTPNAKIAVN